MIVGEGEVENEGEGGGEEDLLVRFKWEEEGCLGDAVEVDA